MSEDLTLEEVKKEWLGSLKAYMIGFFASLFFTTVSFLVFLVAPIKGNTLIWTLAGLGIVQAFIQVRYFLHVGEEPKPRWEMGMFFFMLLVLLIIVIGSVWIMNDLNARTMMGMEM